MTEAGSIFKTNGTDKVYCAIRDEINPRCQEAKMFVEELWGKAHEYLDSDILEELPDQFHQRFWEIYLAASLLESSLNLQHSSGRDGPDICIKADDGSKIWVEAVTASPGQGNDAVQEAEIGTVRSVPDEQIKLRLLNAFAEKSKKYKRYREKNWVSTEEPYIIAINAALVPSASRELEIPRIVRSLLPFGFQVLHLSRETLEVTGNSYEYQGGVIKISGAEIETTSFLNPEYSGISAVIYSCVDVCNYPTEISRALLLFHNPLAKNPLPLGFLKKGYEYWVDEHLKNKNWNQGESSV
jgi:hypothetical protein